jgi:hypothetical protein
VTGSPEKCESLLAHNPRVKNLTAAPPQFRFEFQGSDQEVADLHRELIAQGVSLLWFKDIEANLEEVFMTITKGVVA